MTRSLFSSSEGGRVASDLVAEDGARVTRLRLPRVGLPFASGASSRAGKFASLGEEAGRSKDTLSFLVGEGVVGGVAGT